MKPRTWKPKTWQERLEIARKRDDAMYLAGWDAALLNKSRNSCPYQRRDNRTRWLNGFDRCSRNEALPERFNK